MGARRKHHRALRAGTASSQAAGPERDARKAHYVAWRTRCAQGQRRGWERAGAGNKQARPRATWGGRGARTRRQRIAKNGLRIGRAAQTSSDIARRARIVASRRDGARRAQSARCGMVHGEITSGARKSSVADGSAMARQQASEAGGDIVRPGSKDTPAENRENGLRIGRSSQTPSDIARRAQQRRPHRRKPQGRS